MSRTACCFLALGISVAFAAGCGDDDVQFPNVGGSSGSAGRGGSAGATGGSAGQGGAAGNAGTGGSTAGTGGSTAGTGGSTAGTGGSTAGTGGSTAGTGGSAGTGGTGGSDLPDGGLPDASTPPLPPLDAGGIGSGPCPDFVTAAGDIAEQGGQEVVIARVLFNGDGSADVVLRNPLEAIPNDAGATNFPLIEPRALCSGPDNCQLLEDVCDDNDIDILSGEEVTCTISNTLIDEGELGVLSNSADEPTSFAFAYIQWDVDGNFVSPAPSVGGGESLELRAVDSGTGFWSANETIAVDVNDDTIVTTGDTVVAADFVSCER